MRKIISIILILEIICSFVAIPVVAEEIIDDGKCGIVGDDIKWTLTSSGKLTISGSGHMIDYNWKAADYDRRKSPFSRSDVVKVIIKDGLLNIGGQAFADCENLESIVIPNSVNAISFDAFWHCSNLKEIVIPNTVESIGYGAFEACTSLKTVNIPKGIETIGENTFWSCSSLESILIPKTLKKIYKLNFTGTNLKQVFYEGSKEEWDDIEIAEIGNEDLIAASIHYNSSISGEGQTPLEEIPYKNENCNLDIDFSVLDADGYALDEIFYNIDSLKYNINNFNLNICVTNEAFLTSTKAQNVDVNIILPDGFSFEENSDSREKNIHFNSISIDEEFSETVYLREPKYDDIHTISVEVSGDNVDNEDDFTYDLIVGSHIFTPEKYKADHIIYNSELAKIIENTFNSDTPATTLRNAGERNGLSTSVNFWNAVKNAGKIVDNPANITDVVLEKKDMYEAILWDAFETSCNSDLIDAMQTSIDESGKNAYDTIVKYFKTAYNIDVTQTDSFSRMTASQKEDFFNKMDESFSEKFPGLDNVTRFSGFIGDMSDSVSNIYTICKAAASYYMLYSLNDSVKYVMKEMYRECDGNTSLKTALLNCLAVMDSNEVELAANIAAMVTLTTGKNVLNACVEEMWDKIKDKTYVMHPAAAVFMISYEGSTFICDTLFNTTESAEKYSKLEATVDVKELTLKAYNGIKEYYKHHETEENAKKYNSSIDIMYNVLDADCNISKAFVNTYEESTIGMISSLLGNTTAEERSEQIRNIQNSYSQQYEATLCDWVYELEHDNPKQYEKYKHIITDSMGNITKKYEIACPVDVYIYDLSENLIGSVVNNVPYVANNANITISVVNDEKHIYLDKGKYILKCVGNNIGEMDVKITNYDGTEIDRKVFFENIPLSIGTTYTSKSYTKEYFLSSSDTEIAPDYDTDKNADDTVFYEFNQCNFNIEDNKNEEYSELFTTELWLYIGKNSYYKNGMRGENDVSPVIINDRTMLPIRLIAEVFDCMVNWDGETNTVSVYYDGEKESNYDVFLELQIGDSKIKKTYLDYDKISTHFSEERIAEGLPMTEILPYAEITYIDLDSPAVVMNDRTYVPVRAVSEALSVNVDWDGNNQMVTLSKKELGAFYNNYPDVLNLSYYLLDAPIRSDEGFCRYDVRNSNSDAILNIVSRYLDAMKANGWRIEKMETNVEYILQKDNVTIKFVPDTGFFLDFYSGEFYEIEATNQ